MMMRPITSSCLRLFLTIVLLSAVIHAETGEQAWLRYAPLSAQEAKQCEGLPSNLVVLGDSALLKSAQQELTRGVEAMLGKKLASSNSLPWGGPAIVLGTVESVRAAIPDLQLPALGQDGYWLATKKAGGQERILIAGSDDRGALYGSFALLQKIALAENIEYLEETHTKNP